MVHGSVRDFGGEYMCGECASASPSSAISRRDFIKLGGIGIAGATLLGVMGSGGLMAQTGSTLRSEFEAASKEYGVPLELLLALGYVNTGWITPPTSLGEYKPGDIHGTGGYGVMRLSENPDNNTLKRASEITGIPADKLKEDRAANIQGGAAVLSDIKGENADGDINAWYDPVSEYGEGGLYANQVYEALEEGASAELESGEEIGFEAQEEAEPQSIRTTEAAGDYPGSTFYGAGNGNYGNGRAGYDIDTIVVHVMQGTWSGTINYFRQPGLQVSAHYNIRRSDGAIGQSVRERDTAYHAGHLATNRRSIGIEHEGYVSNRNNFTDAMFRSSARLTAYLCKKYNVPISRVRLIEHKEVPGCSNGAGGGSACHTDPGPYWNWSKYLSLVRDYVGGSGSGDDNSSGQIIDNSKANSFKASGNWKTSSYHKEQSQGPNYHYANPSSSVVDPARFRVRIPKKGQYKIYARWPADPGYNNRATFRIQTSKGVRAKTVSQQRNGGKWVSLGTHPMRAGLGWYVEVSRKSSGKGYVIADAVKVVRK